MWEVVIRGNRQCRTDRDSRTREGGLQKNIMAMLQLLFINIEVQDLSFTLTYAILEYSCALPALCAPPACVAISLSRARGHTLVSQLPSPLSNHFLSFSL